MKRLRFDHIAPIIFSVILLLPFAAKSVHAVQKHDHEICTAKNIKHYHDQDTIDCSAFYRHFVPHAIDTIFLPVIYYPTFNESYATTLVPEESDSYIKSKSSRAPPSFIV